MHEIDVELYRSMSRDEQIAYRKELRKKEEIDFCAEIWTDNIVTIINQADKVEVYRVADIDGGKQQETLSFTVQGEELKPVIQLFNNPSMFGFPTKCVFHSDVAFVFYYLPVSVKITCCFSCTDIKLEYSSDRRYAHMNEITRTNILALLKNKMPNDEYIQQIPDEAN